MASGYRLNLTGLKPGETAPPIAVVLTGRDGKVLHTSTVAADGRFDLPADALKNAYRVLIGPATQDPANTSFEAFAKLRPIDFTAALEKGEIAIARGQWELWRVYTTCVTGHVKLCRRSRWWYDDLVVLSRQPALSRAMSTRMAATSELTRVPVASSVSELIAWPYRCSVICNGRVEVYRRTCCCQPWIVNDPRLDDLIKYLEEVVVIPVPIPGPDPGPGPDPAPFGPESMFFRDGALDTAAVLAKRDLTALRKLPAAEVPAYINARRVSAMPALLVQHAGEGRRRRHQPGRPLQHLLARLAAAPSRVLSRRVRLQGQAALRARLDHGVRRRLREHLVRPERRCGAGVVPRCSPSGAATTAIRARARSSTSTSSATPAARSSRRPPRPDGIASRRRARRAGSSSPPPSTCSTGIATGAARSS